MRDLTSTGWIVAKGLSLAAIAGVAGTLLLIERPGLRTAALLAALVWSVCRFYYFLFYALERYVDPNLRYAGLMALLRALWSRRRRDGAPP